MTGVPQDFVLAERVGVDIVDVAIVRLYTSYAFIPCPMLEMQ